MVHFDCRQSPLYENSAGWGTVDALPYLESVGADYKERVLALIQEEVQRQSVRSQQHDGAVHGDNDTLMETSSSPSLSSFSGRLPPPVATPFLDAAKRDLDATRTHTSSNGECSMIDTTRYDVTRPDHASSSSGSSMADLSAWKNAVMNAESQCENSAGRLINLELMNQFGPNEWSSHLQHATRQRQTWENVYGKVEQEITEINRKRKLQQISAGNDLRDLRASHDDLEARNIAIAEALAHSNNDVVAAVKKCRSMNIPLPSHLDELLMNQQIDDVALTSSSS